MTKVFSYFQLLCPKVVQGERKTKQFECFSLALLYLFIKIGGVSEKQIQINLFCSSLALHYLCIVTAKLKNMATIDDVKNMIERNEVKNAIAQLDVMIELCPELDELYYLRGNAYRKFNSWKNALNDYCKAISLNPNSPAVEAYRASLEILEFFNKDMLNP